MDDYIARENIKRFRAQLQASTDVNQKDVIRELLKAEEAKLDELKVRAAKRSRN